MPLRQRALRLAVTLAASAAAFADAQTPLGAAFSYQGQLQLDGSPLNDMADLQFVLWDAPAAGNPLGPPVALGNVSIVDGLFTVVLDFGAAAFNGQARWLEISVRSPAGGGTFTTLTPRQALTVAPYALFSSAPWATNGNSIFNVNSGSVGVGTNAPVTNLHVVRSLALASQNDSPAIFEMHNCGSGCGQEAYSEAARLLNSNGNGRVGLGFLSDWTSTIETVPQLWIGTGYRGFGRGSDFNIATRADETTLVDRFTIGGDTGNVGIGTVSPQRRLHIDYVGGADGALIRNNLAEDTFAPAEMVFERVATNPSQRAAIGMDYTARDFFIWVNGTDRLNINELGNVGIGTWSPRARLEVQGSITAAGNAGLHNQGAHLEWNRSGFEGETWLLNQRGGGSGGIHFGEIEADETVTERMRITADGDVGIGTGSPQSKLHVAGNIQIDTDARIQFGGATENTDPIWLSRWNNGADQSVLQIELGDNPGGPGITNDAFIITSNDQTLFQFNTQLTGGLAGQALKNGGGSWGVLSDARAKHDVRPLTGALDRVLQLHGRTYAYNDPTMPGAGSGRQTGFVAQEAEQVFPEWIGTLASGLKTLNVTGFEALTVEALRDLRAEKDAEIAALRAEKDVQIEKLAQRLAKLEALLAERTGN